MRRITKLDHDLKDLQHTRHLQRKSRCRSGLAAVTIVGYTNAGKCTLLNRLTQAGVLVEDRLFATLDPTTRRLSLPGGEPVLLTDTVGFVRRLPHGLVEAFKSTLEVASEADFLVHVVDCSAPDPEGQIAAVREVLAEIDAAQRARAAGVQQDRHRPRRGQANSSADHEGSVAVSAVTGEGIDGSCHARRSAAGHHGAGRAADPVRARRRAGLGASRGRGRVDVARGRRRARPCPARRCVGRTAVRVRRRARQPEASSAASATMNVHGER